MENDIIVYREMGREYVLSFENGEYAISSILFDEEGAILDKSCVGHITPCRGEALRIFDLITKHSVSPCTLLDVICDLIC